MLRVGDEAYYKPGKYIVQIKAMYSMAGGDQYAELVHPLGNTFYAWCIDLMAVPKLEIAPGYLPGPSKDPQTWVAPKVECSHDWRWYDSGWSRFEYCFKCDCERAGHEKK